MFALVLLSIALQSFFKVSQKKHAAIYLASWAPSDYNVLVMTALVAPKLHHLLS